MCGADGSAFEVDCSLMTRVTLGFFFFLSGCVGVFIDKCLFDLITTSFSTSCLSFFQGLRKSSDCGRPRKTIMPHSVPHMVKLRKFIVSEDTIFLLLQYAEGEDSTNRQKIKRLLIFCNVYFSSVMSSSHASLYTTQGVLFPVL